MSRRAEILEEERKKGGQSLEGLKKKLKQLEKVSETLAFPPSNQKYFFVNLEKLLDLTSKKSFCCFFVAGNNEERLRCAGFSYRGNAGSEILYFGNSYT